MTTMFDLTDRVAIVSGTASGMGKAMATAFAEAGAGMGVFTVLHKLSDDFNARGFHEPLEFVEDMVLGKFSVALGDGNQNGGSMLDLEFVANRFRHEEDVRDSALIVR